MRKIHNADAAKRGCRWCADSIKPTGNSVRRCPYDECPYHEMDKYETYQEYLEKEAPSFDVDALLRGL